MAKPQRESRNLGIPFDTLQYAKRLEAEGFTREQAEEQAETFLAIVQEQLVTKHDLKTLEVNVIQIIKELEVKITQTIKELEVKTTLECESIRRDIKELEVKMTQQIKELETNSKNQTELLRRDLKIWFGGMLVTLVIAISGIVAIIPHLSSF
jgi:hypothetical protein